VIEGAVEMGLEGETPRVLHAGESWYEPPGAVHSVSRNASDTYAASLLAVFALPEGQAPAVEAH
jgi:quercetin dioxygenase-like cupin family protein